MLELTLLKDLKMVFFNKTKNKNKKTGLIEESQEPEKKIPKWVKLSVFVFNKLKDKIDDAVNKNLGDLF